MNFSIQRSSWVGRNLTEDMIAEEQFNLLERRESHPLYLDPVTISRVDDFLDMISAADVQSNYDADELNRKWNLSRNMAQ